MSHESTAEAAAATAAAATVANKVTIGGASVTGLGWLTSNEFLGLSGFLIAVASLLIGWYYKRETKKLQLLDDERKRREYEGREAERQVRIEFMRKTGIPLHPPKEDTDFGALEMQE
mgnify:CR=1 FL=1